MIARAAQMVGVGRDIGGKFCSIIIDLRALWQLAGHERGPRWCAERRGGVAVFEPHRTRRKTFEIGRMQPLRWPIWEQGAVELIDHQDKDIRFQTVSPISRLKVSRMRRWRPRGPIHRGRISTQRADTPHQSTRPKPAPRWAHAAPQSVAAHAANWRSHGDDKCSASGGLPAPSGPEHRNSAMPKPPRGRNDSGGKTGLDDGFHPRMRRRHLRQSDAHLRAEKRHHMAHGCDENLLLRAEVMMRQSRRNASTLRDLRNSDFQRTTPPDFEHGRLHNLFPPEGFCLGPCMIIPKKMVARLIVR